MKLRVAHASGMPGTFSPPPRVSDPDMHHGTCVKHVPWCMPGSLIIAFSRFPIKSVAGKMFLAFSAPVQPAILRIWQEAHAATCEEGQACLLNTKQWFISKCLYDNHSLVLANYCLVLNTCCILLTSQTINCQVSVCSFSVALLETVLVQQWSQPERRNISYMY